MIANFIYYEQAPFFPNGVYDSIKRTKTNCITTVFKSLAHYELCILNTMFFVVNSMVKKTIQQNQALYQCEACGFEYKEMENAQRCEAFCREHKSCSTEIAKHTIFDNRSIETSSEKEQSFLLSDLPVIVDFWASWCP